jgi:hypothetical protein
LASRSSTSRSPPMPWTRLGICRSPPGNSPCVTLPTRRRGRGPPLPAPLAAHQWRRGRQCRAPLQRHRCIRWGLIQRPRRHQPRAPGWVPSATADSVGVRCRGCHSFIRLDPVWIERMPVPAAEASTDAFVPSSGLRWTRSSATSRAATSGEHVI